MSAHTPGPWGVTANSFVAHVHRGGGMTIASVNVGFETGDANLRLIIAAPELLEACRDALAWLDAFGEHAPIVFGGEPRLSAVLSEAIAKAEGTTS